MNQVMDFPETGIDALIDELEALRVALIAGGSVSLEWIDDGAADLSA